MSRQTEEYRLRVWEALATAGATENEDGSSYQYSVETKYGTLLVSIDDSCTCCRFEGVQSAKAGLAGIYPELLNPFSGKWNWMGGLDHTGDMKDAASFSKMLLWMTNGNGSNPGLALPRPLL